MPWQSAGDGDVLLTGATGFLGMELLARYLERTDRTVLALVRAGDDDHADARLGDVLELLFGSRDAHRGRVVPIAGDIQHPELGLARRDRAQLVARASEIVHCAATVSFTTPLAHSRRINVGGTSGILRLAIEGVRHGVLRRLAHVSTAYVAGTHRGDFGEDDLEVGQGFRNPYEFSKYEAERLVRAHAGDLPAVTILRPSIIVGEAQSGWTPAFNVIYVPLRAFAKRQLRVLPASASAPVDVVPADHVADAMLELTQRDCSGLRTYHLVAGERATTVGELVDLSARHLRRRPPPLVPPAVYRGAYPLMLAWAGRRRRKALRRAGPFLPYYTMRVRYRREHAARRLDPVGLGPPRLDSYYARLLQYAIATNWGRHPLPRPRAAAMPVLV